MYVSVIIDRTPSRRVLYQPDHTCSIFLASSLPLSHLFEDQEALVVSCWSQCQWNGKSGWIVGSQLLLKQPLPSSVQWGQWGWCPIIGKAIEQDLRPNPLVCRAHKWEVSVPCAEGPISTCVGAALWFSLSGTPVCGNSRGGRCKTLASDTGHAKVTHCSPYTYYVLLNGVLWTLIQVLHHQRFSLLKRELCSLYSLFIV